jgi:hypothetical protein
LGEIKLLIVLKVCQQAGDLVVVAQFVEYLSFYVKEASCRLQATSVTHLGLELFDYALGMTRQVQVLCHKGLTKPACP